MNIVKRLAMPFALASCLALSACGTAAQIASSIAVEASTSTPTQVRTLAEAYNAATVTTEAVHVYVDLTNPDRATLLQLQKLNDGVHDALTGLKAANDANQSLVFASFNEALKAFNAYAAAKGITH